MSNFIFQPNGLYYPAYNQLQFGLQSTNSSRGSFRYLLDVYVDDFLLSTLSSNNLPGSTYSNIDVRRIAQTALTYDLNYNVIGATYTPNSIKTFRVESGETYDNVQRIVSIATSSTAPYVGWTTITLPDTSRLAAGDRIEIEIDSLTNTYLNSLWKVVNKAGNVITIDDNTLTPFTFTQSGTVREGREYYDASFNSGKVDITTTNAHQLNSGDEFLLQLDPWAFTLVEVTNVGGTPQVINLTTNVNGVTYSLISSPVSGTTTASVAFNMAAQINSVNPLKFTAFQNPSDRPYVFYIYSSRGEGDITVGADLTFTTSGTIGLTWSQFRKTPSAGPIGGWNGFSGYWKVGVSQSTTSFTTDIPWQNSTITGSQRGSIIPFSNYITKDVQTIGDKWIMNHTFQYENFFDYPNPDTILVEDPRGETGSCIPFSDWSDFHTIDIMTLLGPTGSNVTSFTMRTTYPIGGQFFDYVRSLNIIKGNKEPRLTFGVGPGNLSPLSTTFSTTKPESYRVEIFDNFGNLFYKRDFCYKCRNKEYFRVMWLNKWGAFDYFDFNYSDRSVEGEKETFYRTLGRFDGSKWSKGDGERGLTVYDNRTFDKYLFYTDLLKRNEGEWLVSLFKSPEVYLLTADGLLPIIITNEEVFRFNPGNKVRQLQFEARVAVNNITQIN